MSYLLDTAFACEDVRLYAIHRIRRAEVTDDSVQRPQGFSLDAYIAQGGLHLGSGEPIRLEARVEEWLADILTETLLSADQSLENSGQEIFLSATIHNTWQLHWWILSQGRHHGAGAGRLAKGDRPGFAAGGQKLWFLSRQR